MVELFDEPNNPTKNCHFHDRLFFDSVFEAFSLPGSRVCVTEGKVAEDELL